VNAPPAKSRVVPILVALAGACLIGLLVYGVSQQAVSRSLDQRVHEGKRPPAPDAGTALPLLGGSGTRTLAALRGKVVLLNFWASWCEPCQVEAPLLQHAQAQLLRHDATVVGVTYEDATPDSEGFVRQFHLTYPNLRDTSGFAHAYGTDQLPESFLVDRNGDVVAISRGEIGPQFIEHALALARST
jgi:cytochrome c biogenesis protein CcmG/thiol:disulfide interchange protein DsbE